MALGAALSHLLYPTREAYLRATRAPQWSGAWCTTASVWFTVFWERQRFSTKPAA